MSETSEQQSPVDPGQPEVAATVPALIVDGAPSEAGGPELANEVLGRKALALARILQRRMDSIEGPGPMPHDLDRARLAVRDTASDFAWGMLHPNPDNPDDMRIRTENLLLTVANALEMMGKL